MKYFFLGSMMYRKKGGFSVLLTAFQTISLALILFVIMVFSTSYAIENLTKQLVQRGGMVLSYFGHESQENQDDFIAENYKDDVSVINFKKMSNLSTSVGLVFAQCVTQNMFDVIKYPLSRGKMPTVNENYLEVIATFGKIGRTFSLEYGKEQYNAKVVGIMPKKYPIFDSSSGDLSSIINFRVDSKFQNSVLFLYEGLKENEKIEFNKSNHSWVVFSKNLSEEKKQAFFTKMSTSSSPTFGDLAEGEKERRETTFKPFLFIGLILATIAIINFLLAVLLLTIMSKKESALMFLCGATKKQNSLFLLSYSLLLCLPAIIINIFLANFVIPKIAMEWGSAISIGAQILAYLTHFCIFVGSNILISKFIIKQNKIAEILRGAE